MRRLSLLVLLPIAAAAIIAASAGADNERGYEIEMYNAFGVVKGSDVRVSGVNVGTVKDLSVNERKRAVISVEISGDLAVLGDETTCLSEPQSLIAEYSIDCDSKGEPLPDGAMIPAERVQQTVQPDLVQNTVREPYMARLTLLVNEFGTGLAGNPAALNEAIRLGAPALGEFRNATKILASQRRIIRDLNENSDTIMAELAEQREQVASFVTEAADLGEISASRRDDLSRDFELLDDFLAELGPTLGEFENLALEQTPLLHDLRAAAPELNRLAQSLPPFNRASEGAFESLGEAAVVGRRALRKGREPIRLLKRAGREAPVTTEILADLVRDLDDPRRAVEIDRRAGRDTGRTGTEPAGKDTMGYTGLEGLLNYPYYQALALNQFDQVGHLLHFGLYGVFTGPCKEFSSGRDTSTGEPGVPAEGGGTTTNILEAARCIGWLGPNQPGISEDLGLPKYHPSVCRDGTSPEAAEKELCSPADAARSGDRQRAPAGKAERNRRDRRPGASERERDPDRLPPTGDRGPSPNPLGPLPGLGELPGGPAPRQVPNPIEDLLDFLLSD